MSSMQPASLPSTAATTATTTLLEAPLHAEEPKQPVPLHKQQQKQEQKLQMQQQQQLQKQHRPRSWLEHPLIAWAIENGSIGMIAWLRTLVPQPAEQNYWKLFLNNCVGSLILSDIGVHIQWFLVCKVYKNIPYLTPASEKKDKEVSAKTAVCDWLTCNLPVHVLSSMTSAGLTMLKSPEAYAKGLEANRISFPGILGKLLVARLIADFFFYWVHRGLHTRLLYPLHKRHHEHTSTHMYTNHHFGVIDLYLEGYGPMLVSLIGLDLLKIKSTPKEGAVIAAYLVWNESGSHAGKEMPTLTYFPPLAPFYQLLLGNVDARNTEFHDTHHSRRNCNFGITQWPDYLFGTRRFYGPK